MRGAARDVDRAGLLVHTRSRWTPTYWDLLLELGFALAHLIQLQRICDETEMGKSLSGFGAQSLAGGLPCWLDASSLSQAIRLDGAVVSKDGRRDE